MKVRYEVKEYKSLLNKYKFIDSWFWCRYGVNCYGGCEHACTYCDSRSHKYHLHEDLDHVIYVKKDIGQQLDKRLSRARTLLPDVVALSGATDPYQPAENEFGNTRQVLEVLDKHKYPVFISTKSTLVNRDADLLGSIAEQSAATVAITVTTTETELAGFLEPCAPSPERRFEALKKLKKKAPHVQVGVNAMPLVPFLGDADEQLDLIVRRAKRAGADFILFAAGMTMRDDQAKWFLRKLSERDPGLVDRYLELYEAQMDENDGYKGRYGPRSNYTKEINQKVYTFCERCKINCRVKRFIPEDFRRENYIIAEQLLNEAYFKQAFGQPYKNQYWAGMNINNLKESITDIARRKELKSIRNVDDGMEKRILQRLNDIG